MGEWLLVIVALAYAAWLAIVAFVTTTVALESLLGREIL